MAGETLQDSLSGLRFSGADNSWGLGASTLASSLPALINPRSSVGRNLAIGLGGTLLTALLGYQARQQASEDTIATMGYGNQILGAASPEEQFAIATAVEDTQQKAKLLTLVNALKTNETVNKLNNQVKQADMVREVEQAKLIAEANQGLQLGEQGTAIFNRENQAVQGRAIAMQDRAIAMQAARAAAKPAPSSVAAPSSIAWFKDISPGQLEPLVTAKGTTVEMLQLASDFEKLKQNALEFQSTVNIAGTPANLAYSRLAAIIPRIVRLGGATGAMSDMEEKRIMLATIGNMSSGTTSIAERIKGLTVSALNMAGERAKSLDTMFKPVGGSSLYDTLEFGALGKNPVVENKSDDQEAYRQSLIAQLAAKRRGN